MIEGIGSAIKELHAGIGAAALADRIIAKRDGFDLLRALKFPAGARCRLLHHVERTAVYKVVYEVEAGWYISFDDKNRNQFHLQVAGADDAFAEALGTASHIAVGAVIYGIDPEAKDVDILPPCGDEPWWRVYCSRVTDETFDG